MKREKTQQAKEEFANLLSPEELQAALKDINLQAEDVLRGFRSGQHRGDRFGFSTRFAEHRQYVKGDPLRDLDWKVFARSEKYYVKKYESDIGTECHFLLDCSASMNYRSRKNLPAKSVYSRVLCAALAMLLEKRQDRYSLISFDKDVRGRVESGSGRTQLARLLDVLSHCEQQNHQSDFEQAAETMAPLVTRSGFCLIFSDLLGNWEALLPFIDQMRFKKQTVILFHIFDPAEIELDFDAPHRFYDPENAEQEQILVESSEIRQTYREVIEEYFTEVEKQLQLRQVRYLRLRTDESPIKALTHFFENYR